MSSNPARGKNMAIATRNGRDAVRATYILCTVHDVVYMVQVAVQESLKQGLAVINSILLLVNSYTVTYELCLAKAT